MNHLEELIAEWYEFNGYFVRRNVKVNPRSNGGYESELDIIAFNPEIKKVIHIETSLDTISWAKREIRFRKKFEIGAAEIPNIFRGFRLPNEIHQEAVFLFAGRRVKEKGGAKIKLAEDYITEMYEVLKKQKLNKSMVSEQFPLLRTIQFVSNLKGNE